MRGVLVPVLILSLFCSFRFMTVCSVEDDVKRSLTSFLCSLSSCGDNNSLQDPRFNWTADSDPCTNNWNRVECDRRDSSVTRIYLDGLSLSGTLNLTLLCGVPAVAKSLSILVLEGNTITGEVTPDISSCNQLTRFQVSGNRLSGNLPKTLSTLNNLRKLDLSSNNFSGELPNLRRTSGLKTFDGRNNSFTGKIPEFDFSNLNYFNVSNNNLTGPIPRAARRFDAECFLGNSLLCGAPLANKCPKSKGPSAVHILMYSGYALLGSIIIGILVYKICHHKKKGEAKEFDSKAGDSKVAALEDGGGNKEILESGEVSKTINSLESGPVSTALVVLTSPSANGLRFEDLLRAPAEMLSRGKHGSLYKVTCEDGMTFAVKRIKGWAISSEEFKKRMQKIDEVKHPNVLPVVAFYSSKQEKLLVYEFQQAGSLFRLLHGLQLGQIFEWTARLNVAAGIAQGLAAMHQHLRGSNIAHRNLKSSNILFYKNMEPIISEYGLMPLESDTPPDNNTTTTGTFEADIYALGVILLELLTGRLVQKNGFDLAKWVHSVLREEWTVEVFDKSLISEGASEERMVDLLQVAVKCVNPAPASRPNADQIATMISSIRDDEDRSLAFEP